jgi:hypothetical protein
MDEIDIMNLDENGKVLGMIRRMSEACGDETGVDEMVWSRLKVGAENYGHGVRVHADTRDYDTVQNSWAEMALEEVLDAIIYCAAQAVREEEAGTDIMQRMRMDMAVTSLMYAAGILRTHMGCDL